jgi:hypothetical protein
MNKPSILKYALLNATLTACYVILIGLFFRNAKALFGDGPESLLIPMGMLLLFIFSALVCGGLVLGRPIMWYLDGQKKEALKLLGYTTLVIFIIMIIVFIALFIVSNL